MDWERKNAHPLLFPHHPLQEILGHNAMALVPLGWWAADAGLFQVSNGQSQSSLLCTLSLSLRIFFSIMDMSLVLFNMSFSWELALRTTSSKLPVFKLKFWLLGLLHMSMLRILMFPF